MKTAQPKGLMILTWNNPILKWMKLLITYVVFVYDLFMLMIITLGGFSKDPDADICGQVHR